MESLKSHPLAGGLVSEVVLETNSSSASWADHYSHLMHVKRDPRVDGWLLMDSIVPTLVLSSFYLLFVMVLGPKLMEKRAPFEVKYPMLAYNLFQVFFNLWIFIGGASYWFSGEYNLVCQPVDYSNHPRATFALSMSWWFYFSKFLDFADSVFFVLRKKKDQLTTLHLIHHSTMPIFSWFGPKFAGGGNTTFGGTWNMFVHVIMYGYYFLAAAGVRKELLWWKKYLTSLQMVQFLAVILHAAIPIFLPTCKYPKEMCYLMMFNAAMYWVLFWNFYQSSYGKKSAHRKQH